MVDKPKSFREIVEKYAEEIGKTPRELEEVKLIFQMPPLEKIDSNVLKQLENCKYLRLSTNAIPQMPPFQEMKKLKILTLSRNQIKIIRGLDDLAETLEELWLSYNSISRLDGLSKLEVLKVLYIAHNLISDWNEVSKLTFNKNLETVVFIGNDIYKGTGHEHGPRLEVIRRIPYLKMIDGVSVGMDEKDEAAEIQKKLDEAED
jgi:dynein light chain 1